VYFGGSLRGRPYKRRERVKTTAGGLGGEEKGTACNDAIVFFVFYVHQTNVKILLGQFYELPNPSF